MTMPLILLDSLIDTFQIEKYCSNVTIMDTSKPIIDLTIFKSKDNHCDHAEIGNWGSSELNGNTDISNLCLPLQRIISCQQWYKSLDVQNNNNNAEILTRFIMEIYCNDVMINDYEHLMANHKNNIYQINQTILNQKSTTKCVLSTCGATSRHYTRNEYLNENDKSTNDANLSFFCQLLDTVHFYLYHTFECSLRMIPTEFRTDHNGNYNDHKNYVDDISKFKLLTNEMRRSRIRTDKFQRFSETNTKFSIAIDQTNQGIPSSTTFMDELTNYIKQFGKDCDLGPCNKLVKDLTDEEFDTDAVKLDLSEHSDGNINTHNYGKRLSKLVYNFVKAQDSYILFFHLLFLSFHCMENFFFV